MISLDQIRSSVDPYSGAVAFSLPLAVLQSGVGPVVELVLDYQSSVRHIVTSDNQTAPTGVAGLGWNLPIDRIVANFNDTMALHDREYLLIISNVPNRLVQIGEQSNSGTSNVLEFALQGYEFWNIRYYTTDERWEIITEDGIRYTYGDRFSNRATVEQGVAWGNWLGSSSNTEAQQSVAVAWNLSTIADLWDNTVSYHYEQVTENVGSSNGQLYTQATYLSRITAADGQFVRLNHADKDSKEYQDPHTSPLPPNAWQSQFETRFLQSVDIMSSESTLLHSVVLNYGAPDFVGQGSMSKRLLKSVAMHYPQGGRPPGVRFDYYTGPGDDHWLGSMKAITTPAGGVADFEYQNTSVGVSSRDMIIQKPATPAGNYINPRVYFSAEYVVVSWYNPGSQSIKITSMSWAGRWLRDDTLASLPLATATAYDEVQVSVAESCFAVSANAQLAVYYRNPRLDGSWLSTASPIALSLDAGESTRTVCGDGYAAVLGLSSAKLNVVTWDGQVWTEHEVSTLAGGSAPGMVCQMAGTEGYLLTVSISEPASPVIDVQLLYLDSVGVWRSTAMQLTHGMPRIDSIDVYPGKAFAAITATGPSGSRTRLQLDVVSWSADMTGLHATRLSQGVHDQSGSLPMVSVQASTVFVGQQAFRFNGQGWNHQDLSSLSNPTQAPVESLSYAADCLLRALKLDDDQAAYDLLSYNPGNVTPTPWSQQIGNTLPDGNQVARASTVSNRQSRYVILGASDSGVQGNALYFNLPDRGWRKVFTIPDTLSASELPSLQLLAEHYCIYQSGNNTVVYTLANGTTSTAKRSSTIGSIQIPSQPPDTLLGEQAFVSFTGIWDADDVELTVHRVVNDAINDVQSTVTVKTVQSQDGYNGIATDYHYVSGSAVMAASGFSAGFNKVTAYERPANSTQLNHGGTSVFFFNNLMPQDPVNAIERPVYPGGPSSNASDYLSLLAGRSYKTEINWLDTELQAQLNVSSQYLWVVEQALLANGHSGPIGYYVQRRQSVDHQDGVTSTVTTSFNTLNGLPSVISTDLFNSLGQVEVKSQTFSYFPEHYTGDVPENLLSPIVQTTSTTDGTATASSVTTWRKDWGGQNQYWAVDAQYVASVADYEPFTGWSDQAAEQPGWLRVERVLSRNALGSAERMGDALGRISSRLFDISGSQLVAGFGNADIAASQASYYGFETYEQNTHWDYIGPGVLADHIVTSHANTGSRSLQLIANSVDENGPTATFLRSTDGRSYLFSCWMLMPTDFVQASDLSRWQLSVYTLNTPSTLVATEYLPFPAADGGNWQYLFKIVDLGKIRAEAQLGADVPLSITVSAYNRQTNSPDCYIDSLRITPVVSNFNASVYDPASRILCAAIGENGQIMRTVRNASQQVITAIGPDENINSLSIPAFSRDMSGNDSFNPEIPNCILDIASSSAGLYFDFDHSDANAWLPATGWSIADNKLQFAGAHAGPIGSRVTLKEWVNGQWQDFVHSNYSLRIQLGYDGQTPPVFAVGTGNLFIYWQPQSPDGLWTLAHFEQGVLVVDATRDAAFGIDWVFAIVDELVMFYVDGNQIFTHQLHDIASTGKVQLALTGPGWFKEAVVSVDPSLQMRFSDGAGTEIQQLALAGAEQVVASGFVPNELGQPAYQKNVVDSRIQIEVPAISATGTGDHVATVSDSQPDQNRAIANLGSYLPLGSNGQQLTIDEYINPAISGAPYTQTRFEASPLARPIEIGLPGVEYTIGSGHTYHVKRGSTVHGGIMSDLLPAQAPGLASGSYYLNTETDPDGNHCENVFNKVGQVVAQRLIPAASQSASQSGSDQAGSDEAGNADPISTMYLYDAAGNLSSVRMPNYYRVPAGSVAENWQQNNTYTFLGKLASNSKPDWGNTSSPASQITRYQYDLAQRLRFVLDPNGASMQPSSRILYFKYDDLDRLVEQGYVMQADINWTTIAQFTDQPEWPGSDVTSAIWDRRYVYDLHHPISTNHTQPANLIGQLYQVQTNTTQTRSPAHFDTETFSYDRRGRTLTSTTAVPEFDAHHYRSGYAYNDMDQLIQITYPQQIDGGGLNAGRANSDGIRHSSNDSAINQSDNQIDEPIDVSYSYDRLGKLVGVGVAAEGTEVIDPDNPVNGPMVRFAHYEYGSDQRLATESFNAQSETPIKRSLSYTTGGLLSQLSGDYFTQQLSFGSDGYAGSSNYRGQITRAKSRYFAAPGNNEFDAPVLQQRDWQYAYDATGQMLVAASSDNIVNASLDIGGSGQHMNYDANGNILSVPRLPSQQNYHYNTAGSDTHTGDRVQAVTGTTQISQQFSATENQPGWSWGSSNAGPSQSGIISKPAESGTDNSATDKSVTDESVTEKSATDISGTVPIDAGSSAAKNDLSFEATDFLRLDGGSLGHFEYLQFTGYLDIANTYTLQFRWRAPEPFGQQSGRAGWFLRLHTAAGMELDHAISVLDSGGADWTDSPVTDIDISDIVDKAGLSTSITAVSLVLINAKQNANGMHGAHIDIDSVSINSKASSPSEWQAYQYDANGNIVASPSRGISSIEYDPLSGRSNSISLEQGAAISSIKLSSGIDGRTRLSTVNLADGSTKKTLHIRGPGGMPLATLSEHAGNLQTRRYLHGRDGLIGTFAGANKPYSAEYVLKDYLGSTRAIVDESQALLQRYDYGPFGELIEADGSEPWEYRYTGQPELDATGLADYGARQYDSRLRRFYAVDAHDGIATPYAYAHNDPINRIDPDGNDWQFALGSAASVGAGMIGLGIATSGLIFPIPTGIAAGIAVAGSALSRYLAVTANPAAPVLPLVLGPLLTRVFAARDPYVPINYRNNGLSMTVRNIAIGMVAAPVSFGALGALESSVKSWWNGPDSSTNSTRAWDDFKSSAVTGAQWYGTRAVTSAVIGQVSVWLRGPRLLAVWNGLARKVVRKGHFLDNLSTVERSYIFSEDDFKEKIKRYLRRPGKQHEWLQVGWYPQIAGNFGILVEQIYAERTTTATNPMFSHGGGLWGHTGTGSGRGHRINEGMLDQASSAVIYEVMRWHKGLVAPGAEPASYALTSLHFWIWQSTN